MSKKRYGEVVVDRDKVDALLGMGYTMVSGGGAKVILEKEMRDTTIVQTVDGSKIITTYRRK